MPFNINQFGLVAAAILFAAAAVEANHRQMRALPFPDGSTVGILAAIATPIEIGEREIFFSYNFEANYNSHAASDLVSLAALDKYNIFEGRSGSDRATNSSAKTETSTAAPTAPRKKVVKRGLASYLSRKIFYDFLEQKMRSFGLDGRACLLKTICQVADIALGRNNGLLGDLVHVIFTPSTSWDKVGEHYFRAENAGSSIGCRQYSDRCPRSILDYISVAEVN